MIDISFSWRSDDLIDDGDTGDSTLMQGHETDEVAIQKSARDAGTMKESGADPYDNEYWIPLPRQ